MSSFSEGCFGCDMHILLGTFYYVIVSINKMISPVHNCEACFKVFKTILTVYTADIIINVGFCLNNKVSMLLFSLGLSDSMIYSTSYTFIKPFEPRKLSL